MSTRPALLGEGAQSRTEDRPGARKFPLRMRSPVGFTLLGPAVMLGSWTRSTGRRRTATAAQSCTK